MNELDPDLDYQTIGLFRSCCCQAVLIYLASMLIIAISVLWLVTR